MFRYFRDLQCFLPVSYTSTVLECKKYTSGIYIHLKVPAFICLVNYSCHFGHASEVDGTVKLAQSFNGA